ncbi:MAG: hypothetical protein AAFW88_13945, partial [Pseudomonadota bacterium]
MLGALTDLMAGLALAEDLLAGLHLLGVEFDNGGFDLSRCFLNLGFCAGRGFFAAAAASAADGFKKYSDAMTAAGADGL